MNKTQTTEYEFLARLLSPTPRYCFRFKDRVFVTNEHNRESMLRTYPNYWTDAMIDDVLMSNDTDGIMYRLDIDYFMVAAHTYRGAWKKACKKLNHLSSST